MAIAHPNAGVIYLYLVFDIANEIDGRACSLLDRDCSGKCHIQRVSASPETSGVSLATALTGVSKWCKRNGN